MHTIATLLCGIEFSWELPLWSTEKSRRITSWGEILGFPNSSNWNHVRYTQTFITRTYKGTLPTKNGEATTFEAFPEEVVHCTPPKIHMETLKPTQFWKGESSSIHIHDFGLPSKNCPGVFWHPFLTPYFFRLQQKSTNVKNKTERNGKLSVEETEKLSVGSWKKKHVNQLDKLHIIFHTSRLPKPNQFFSIGFLYSPPVKRESGTLVFCEPGRKVQALLGCMQSIRWKHLWYLSSCGHPGQLQETRGFAELKHKGCVGNLQAASPAKGSTKTRIVVEAAGPSEGLLFWLFEWLRGLLMSAYY